MAGGGGGDVHACEYTTPRHEGDMVRNKRKGRRREKERDKRKRRRKKKKRDINLLKGELESGWRSNYGVKDIRSARPHWSIFDYWKGCHSAQQHR